MPSRLLRTDQATTSTATPTPGRRSASAPPIWRECYAQYPFMTSELTISHGMCLPMLAEYGTDEQKAAYLADNIAARTVWCQMFSEPGAGSDVGSLQSRAVLDGEEWVLNGQKVWTTLAHLCDHGIVIARTDPDQPKHAGISMFIIGDRVLGLPREPSVDTQVPFKELKVGTQR